jgi:hypothetical protein
MPGSANIVLPLLDVLSTSGKQYGDAYLTLPLLRATGSVDEHSNGALTLPMLTLNVTMSQGAVFSSNPTLPSLEAKGYFGANGRVTLPMLTFAGGMTIPVVWSVDVVLPMVTAQGQVAGSESMAGAGILPRLVVAGSFGGDGAAVLPRLVVAGSFVTDERSTGAVILPALRVSGTFASAVAEAWRGAILLPALVAGPYGTARFVLPMLRVHGEQLMTGIPALAGAFEGWLLNTRTGAITRVTNLPFTQFATVGNKTYAVGPGGLYLLGGDTDNGVGINWQFETGLDDLGRPGTKHIPYLYLDGIIDGVVQITLIDDRGREFGYEYNTKQRGAIHLPHRRKLGNGIRTRSMAFRISSDTGAYIELDSLEPQITVTQRSIG